MVPLDEVAPAGVSELRDFLRRPDDVGEEDGREHAVELGFLRPHGGEEPLDLLDHRVLVDCPGEVVVPR